MKSYDHKKIEKKWRKNWETSNIYQTLSAKKALAKNMKPYYVLDMFPYPSGAGLHVGHPRGYIASDVVARMKRMQGYNVLHPMGFDSFGLPTEQYAIKTGKSPVILSDQLVKLYKEQLSILGFSYDWDRQVATHDPEYYRWTQWIFLQIFNSWYDKTKNKARPIDELVKIFETSGNTKVNAVSSNDVVSFSAKEWKVSSDIEKQNILMKYRLAYEGYAEVNWCEEMGTVLANDEVIEVNGKMVSERGEFPVVKKQMRQWFMRITAYADRLIDGLQTIDWSHSIKEIQRNWIGKSEGSEIEFKIVSNKPKYLIFDFDGVIGDTYEASIAAQVISDNLTQEQARAACDAYADRKPNHVRGSSPEEIAASDEWSRQYAFEIVKQDLKLFQGMVDEIKKDSNLVYAVVSSGPSVYVKPMTEKAGLTPTHILAYEDHHSKEEKIENICKDWGISVNEVVYITDTKADVYELEDILGKHNLYGCVWGYCGYKKLKEVLPENQILHNFSDIHKITTKHTAKVFTTRADTLFGVTYVVLAPEHALITELKSEIKNWKEVEKYVQSIKSKSDEDRTAAKEKTGIQLDGIFAVNPANNEQVPVWIADYVLAGYGTGAVMAVPAHDERDFEFAQKYELPIKVVIRPVLGENLDFYGTYLLDGKLFNSDSFDGETSEDARKKITEFVHGKLVTKYKMRDAIFARQRYWGEPIPLVHSKDGIIKTVPEKQLPLTLPKVKSYEPSGNGEGPLATVKSWTEAGYETNTMPGWAGSSWYFLRYADPKNKKKFADEVELDYWFGKNGGVNMYVGGAEHATGHLLYSRFWHKVLKDLGHVKTEEPFKTLRNQGMIGGADGRKMSKRWGNVINPDDVVNDMGADTMRVYESFMGPFEAHLPWSIDGIAGSRRFIERVWNMQSKVGNAKTSVELEKVIHKTIKKVTDDIANFSFNTAISAMMICINEIDKVGSIHVNEFKMLLQILAPFAPHMTDELWEQLGEKKSIHIAPWPMFDPKKIIDDTVTIGIQINGKVRSEITLELNATLEQVQEIVLNVPEVQKWIEGKQVKKFIYVPGKIISIVI